MVGSSHVGAQPSGTTEHRKSAAVAAIKFDKLLKLKGIKSTSLDEWLEDYGKYRLSVDTLFVETNKQQFGPKCHSPTK